MTTTTDNALRRALPEFFERQLKRIKEIPADPSYRSGYVDAITNVKAVFEALTAPHPQASDDWRAGVEAAAKVADKNALLGSESAVVIAMEIRNLQPPASVEATGGGREWRCFHCDEVFSDREVAERHFGTRQYDAPLCAADQFELVETRKERDKYGDIKAQLTGEIIEARDKLASLSATAPHDQPGSPEREDTDDEHGMVWWNKLTDAGRAEWMQAAGNTGRAKDAWDTYKAATSQENRERVANKIATAKGIQLWSEVYDPYDLHRAYQTSKDLLSDDEINAILASLRTTPAPSEVDRLRRDCAELYQVIGTMAEHCPDPEDAAIIKALDNASDAASGDPRSHDDLLPFVLPEPATSVCSVCQTTLDQRVDKVLTDLENAVAAVEPAPCVDRGNVQEHEIAQALIALDRSADRLRRMAADDAPPILVSGEAEIIEKRIATIRASLRTTGGAA